MQQLLKYPPFSILSLANLIFHPAVRVIYKMSHPCLKPSTVSHSTWNKMPRRHLGDKAPQGGPRPSPQPRVAPTSPTLPETLRLSDPPCGSLSPRRLFPDELTPTTHLSSLSWSTWKGFSVYLCGHQSYVHLSSLLAVMKIQRQCLFCSSL